MEDWEKKKLKKQLDDIIDGEPKGQATIDVVQITCRSKIHLEYNCLVGIGGVFEDTTYTI